MKIQEIRMQQSKVLAGCKQYCIAEILGVTNRTVRNYLKVGTAQNPALRKKRKSKLNHSHIRT